MYGRPTSRKHVPLNDIRDEDVDEETPVHCLLSYTVTQVRSYWLPVSHLSMCVCV